MKSNLQSINPAVNFYIIQFMRTTRKPKSPSPDVTDLPPDVLRKQLIERGMHPLVVGWLADDRLVPTVRDLETRLCIPRFGYSLSKFDSRVVFPRPVPEQYQALQSVQDKPPPKVVPDELPMEMTVELLDYGVLQTTIDTMTKQQIEVVYDGLRANREVADVVKEAGLPRGSGLVVEDSQATEESRLCGVSEESEHEGEDDDEDHRDERW